MCIAFTFNTVATKLPFPDDRLLLKSRTITVVLLSYTE